jgi:hypothetical protein
VHLQAIGQWTSSLPDSVKSLVSQAGLRSNAAANPSTPTAAAPFDAYSQGSLNYDLPNAFYERTSYTPSGYTCSGAGDDATVQQDADISNIWIRSAELKKCE